MNAAECAISIAKKEESSSTSLIALHVMYSPTGYAYSEDNVLGLTTTTPSSIEDLLEKYRLRSLNRLRLKSDRF